MKQFAKDWIECGVGFFKPPGTTGADGEFIAFKETDLECVGRIVLACVTFVTFIIAPAAMILSVAVAVIR